MFNFNCLPRPPTGAVSMPDADEDDILPGLGALEESLRRALASQDFLNLLPQAPPQFRVSDFLAVLPPPIPTTHAQLGTLSLSSLFPMPRHDKSGSGMAKESQILHSGLNIFEDGDLGGLDEQSSGVGSGTGSPPMAGDGYHPMLGNTASAFTPTSSLSYGSYLSAGGYQANPRTGWPVGSETNGLVNNQSLLEPCECQTLPGQTGTYSTNEWQHLPGTQYRGSDHQLFGYNPHTYYTLGDSSSFSPQTSLGFAHPTGTPLKAAPEDDDVDFMANFSVPSYDSSGSFSSTAASDMMTTMAHRDAELPWASAVRGGRLVPNGLPSMIDSAGPSPVEQTLSSPTPWRIPDVSSAAQNQTVSPKMLRLRPTPTPTSSSESIRTSFLDSGRGDAVPSQNDSQRASSVVIDTDLPFMSSTVMRPRRPLPDRATPRQEGETTRHHPHPPVNTSSTQQKNFSSRYEPYPKLGSTRSPPPLRPLSMLTPAPPKPPVHGYTPAAPVTYTDPDSEERKKKDEFLINAKQKGLTYKQIRKLGGFTEAESTLRGRYRTLTKSREARVRKPEWSEIDIYLLEKSVRSHATDPSFGFTKIPWKKVAEYIATNGGSYHFGNSTCRKKWDEYVQEQIAMGKDIRRPFYEQDEGSVYYKGGGGYLGGQF